uniref:Uncharacterized protein n=1 Tax=Lactuca sativa TaxID=4236 RepID=A0A9R1X632_LACSA|nr:hypothetical protein LSAT_V11C600335310 [Lactuca sativa]
MVLKLERNTKNGFPTIDIGSAELHEIGHNDLEQKVDLTLKNVVDTIIKDYFLQLTQSQQTLFEAPPFGRFLGMHVPNSDPLLVYLMVLHEVRSRQLFESGRFLFEIHRCSWILARLFPYITDARLQLRDLEEYIISLNYLQLHDEDMVIIIQLVFMLKDLHGWDVKRCIPASVCMGYIFMDLYFGVDA